MINDKKKVILLSGVICILILIFALIALMGNEKDKSGVKIGFIMSGSVGEDGWNGMHYNGVKSACNNLNVDLLVKENVKEFSGDCKDAINELVKEGAQMIILSSYGYSEEAYELVKQYPEIVFYGNSSEYHDVNMTSYFVKMYQARYLAGVVAGLKTRSNEIGYVAAMANNEVNRGINAFTLGVKSVNPKAEVVVAWTGDWDSEEKEKEAATLLIEEEEVDMMTYHQNQPNVIKVAEEKDVYSIGYHEVPEGCSDKYLTTVICNWELVYYEIIREFMVGNANKKDNYWIGMDVDAVGLSAFSKEVDENIQESVTKAKNEILTGADVFSGVIYDNEGKLRCNEKESISDEVLLEHLDWFVEGVRFYDE